MPVIGESSGSRAQMKKEILNEIRHEERRRKLTSCLVWLAIKLVLLAIPVVLVAVLVAKSGFYEIPVLSGWLYQPSAPQRVVQPLVGYDSDQVLKSALARAQYDAAVGLLKVDLTETELTTLASAAAESSPVQDSVLPIKSVQMTCGPDGIELFAVMPRSDRDVTVKMLFVPSLSESGDLVLTVESLRIGSLDIPKALINPISRAVSSQISHQLSASSTGAGQIKGVRVGEQKLYLDFKPELKLPF